MAGQNTMPLTDANFEDEVIKASMPVLVDFGAEWCQPCKMLAPIMEQLATDYQGRAKVGKVDIDEAQKVSAQYSVVGLPTVIVFKNGQELTRLSGLRAKKDFEVLIDQALAPN